MASIGSSGGMTVAGSDTPDYLEDLPGSFGAGEAATNDVDGFGRNRAIGHGRTGSAFWA